MSLRIRRGTDAQRQGITFDLGEPIWTTDTQKLYVGDGITAGGNNILAQSAGAGMTWNATTQKFDVTGGGGGGGITAIVQDTNPTLGGNLSLSGYNITGAGNISITGSISTSGTANFTGGLGGNLNLNGNNIVGTGNITTTGTLAPSGGILGTGNNTAKLVFPTNINNEINFVVSVDGTLAGTGAVTLNTARGTTSVPTTTNANDYLGGMAIRGYNGTSFLPAVSMGVNWESTANLNTAFPASKFGIFVGTNGVAPVAMSFNYQGILNAPIFRSSVYSVAGTPLPSAATMGQGAIAFVSDATSTTFASAYTGGGSNKVPVYSDGTIWRIG